MKAGVVASLLCSSVPSSEAISLDLMILQDTSRSHEDDMYILPKQASQLFDFVTNKFSKSRLGVAEFKDKPFWPLGSQQEFSYRLVETLTHEPYKFRAAFDRLDCWSSGDLAQDHFQALINVVLDPAVGWRPASEGACRIVVMSTDAQPHLPQDISKFDPVTWPDLPQALPPNTGFFTSVNDSTLVDYPSAEQVKLALHSMNVSLVLLTPRDPDIIVTWKWVNEDLLNQAPIYYQYIAANSRDFASAAIEAITAVVAEQTRMDHL